MPPLEQLARFRASFDYFSFATLTTLGYGDILPVQPIARGVSVLEAALGQLLPTILIARVVTLASEGSNSEEDPPA